MKLQPFNRGPLFINCLESSFTDENGAEVRISESKAICSPAPTEYIRQSGGATRSLTEWQYKDLLKRAK